MSPPPSIIHWLTFCSYINMLFKAWGLKKRRPVLLLEVEYEWSLGHTLHVRAAQYIYNIFPFAMVIEGEIYSSFLCLPLQKVHVPLSIPFSLSLFQGNLSFFFIFDLRVINHNGRCPLVWTNHQTFTCPGFLL